MSRTKRVWANKMSESLNLTFPPRFKLILKKTIKSSVQTFKKEQDRSIIEAFIACCLLAVAYS